MICVKWQGGMVGDELSSSPTIPPCHFTQIMHLELVFRNQSFSSSSSILYISSGLDDLTITRSQHIVWEDALLIKSYT